MDLSKPDPEVGHFVAEELAQVQGVDHVPGRQFLLTEVVLSHELTKLLAPLTRRQLCVP